MEEQEPEEEEEEEDTYNGEAEEVEKIQRRSSASSESQKPPYLAEVLEDLEVHEEEVDGHHVELLHQRESDWLEVDVLHCD